MEIDEAKVDRGAGHLAPQTRIPSQRLSTSRSRRRNDQCDPN